MGFAVSDVEPSKLSLLRDLPRKHLSPEQQLEAVKKVQAQAEQRVKLGMQLFKAAEARLASQQEMVDKFRAEQNTLRDQIQQDVAKTLQDYDQWVGRIDESFTHAIQRLEERLDGLEKSVAESDQRVRKMLERAEGMIEQTRYLLENERGTPHPPHQAMASAAPSEPTPTPQPPQRKAPQAVPPGDASRVHAEPSAPLPPTGGETEPAAPPSETEQEKVYSRLLDQLRRYADEGPTSEAA